MQSPTLTEPSKHEQPETSSSPSKAATPQQAPKPPHPTPNLDTERLLTISKCFRWILSLSREDRLNQVAFSLHDLLIRDVLAWANEDSESLDAAILSSLFKQTTTKGPHNITIDEEAYRVACEICKHSPHINADFQVLGTVMLRLIGSRVLWAYALQRWSETNPTPVAIG